MRNIFLLLFAVTIIGGFCFGCDKQPTIPDEPTGIICGEITAMSDVEDNFIMIATFKYEHEGVMFIAENQELIFEKQ